MPEELTSLPFNKIRITCLNCSREFFVTQSTAIYDCKSNNKQYTRKYCSKKCFHEHLKSKKVINVARNCLFCGKEFFVKQSVLNNTCNNNNVNYASYCSKSCFGKANRHNIFINCEQCGVEIRISKSRLGIKKFCSSKCASLSLKKPKSNNIVVERKRYESKQWTKDVYKRDNWTCQHCGKRGGKLNAHHIIPFSVDESLRYEVSNGITLCVGCHKIEHKRLEQDSIIQRSIFDIQKGKREVLQ